MKIRIFVRCFHVAVCGLAAAALCACGGDGDSSGSGGSGGSSSSSSGSSSDSSSSSGSSSSSSASSGSSSASTGGGGDSSLIDDMEDGDAAIAPFGGRLGYWYVFNDGKGGKQTPDGMAFTMEKLAEPRGASTKAAHTTGSGFVDYAGIGFNFKLNGKDKVVYDASAYKGITFWAKKAPKSTAAVRMTLPDANTDPDGKVCTATGCYDHFGADIKLTDDWAEYTFMFADLKQTGFGDPKPAAIDAKQVYGVQFQIVPATGEFDYWIDDIAFTE